MRYLWLVLAVLLAALVGFRFGQISLTCQYKVIWNETDTAALNMQGSDGWRLVAVGSGKIAGAEFFERCHN